MHPEHIHFSKVLAWIIKFIINKTIHLCPILHLLHLKWEIRSVFNSGLQGSTSAANLQK